MTAVNEEEAPVPQRPSTSLEPTLLLAITRIEGLNITVGEQNKRIEELVQDNGRLRDELINLSRTFQLSKRDLQRVENTIPKLTAELKTRFEKMLEKTEGRIQGPIDRLLEELGRLRARPPTPVHVSSITTFPQNTQFVPESQTEGEGNWAPQEEYNTPGPSNKQPHYQENCEPHVQPVRSALLSMASLIYPRSLPNTITMVEAAIAHSADAGAVHDQDIPETATTTHVPPTHPSQRDGRSYQCEHHLLQAQVPQLHLSTKPQQQHRLHYLPQPRYLRLPQLLHQLLHLHLFLLLLLLPAPSPPPDAAIPITPKAHHHHHHHTLPNNHHNHTHTPVRTPNRAYRPRITMPTYRRLHRATALPVPTTVSASAKPRQSAEEHTRTECRRRRLHVRVRVHSALRTATTTRPRLRQHLLHVLVRSRTSSIGTRIRTGMTSGSVRDPRRRRWTMRTRMMGCDMLTTRRRQRIHLCVTMINRNRKHNRNSSSPHNRNNCHSSSSNNNSSNSDGWRRLLCRRVIMRCLIVIDVIMTVIANNNNSANSSNNGRTSRISNISSISSIGPVGVNGAAALAGPEAGVRARVGDM